MKLKINLATRPYRDFRLFLRTWGTGTILLAVLTVGLCWYTYHAWHQTRYGREQIAQAQGEIDKLDRDRAAGIALLNQPQNREIADRSAFLNGLIAQRSFSWTQLFMELERIMPPRLHVTSIAPSLTKSSEIEIHMVVAGDARDQALELVRRLEDSPAFKRPELRSESLIQNSSGGPANADRVQFDISMLYVPKISPEQAGADKAAPEQAANNEDKAAGPANGKKGKADDPAKDAKEKPVKPAEKGKAANRSAGKKLDRAAQAGPAGGKGMAR